MKDSGRTGMKNLASVGSIFSFFFCFKELKKWKLKDDGRNEGKIFVSWKVFFGGGGGVEEVEVDRWKMVYANEFELD